MNDDANLYKSLYEKEKTDRKKKTIDRYKQRKLKAKERQEKIFTVITYIAAIIILNMMLYIWLTGCDSLIEFFI